MKLSKILRPLVTGVAALAVGIAATLVGVQFATPPSDVLFAPSTESAPVIEPVGFGAAGPGGGIFDVSDATANTEIAVEGGADALAEVTSRLIDELSAADDPGDVGDSSITVYDESSPAGSAAGDDDGDPCAPREGEAPATCPDGLHSTVLALVAPESPFYVIASSSPPTYDASPYKLLYCDPQDHDEFGLPIGVSTNAPASITMRYWPSGDPADVTEVDLETSAADRAAWESGLAAASGFTGRWTRPQHCLVLDGLEKYTTYRASFEATDILGRTATDDWAFMLPEDRTVPPTRVVPLADNILFVSAPHTASQDVDARVWRVAPGIEASCANPAARSSGLEELQELRTTDVSAEFLASHRYQPAYTKRTSAAYWVPEGSTILVCLRWLNPDRPSWDWDASIRQYEHVLQSPDRTVPVVSLESVSLARTVAAGAIELLGRTREGQVCGGWSGPEADTDTIGVAAGTTICAFSYFGASSRGDVVISASVTQGDNETQQSSVLPLSREVCRGACAVPESSWYRVTLPTLRVGTGLCGSSFGSCDPPTAEVAAGSALLRVDWTQGDTNGQTEWALGLASTGTPDRVRAEGPQMNTFQQLTLRPGAFTGTYDLGFTLVTDRPVTYTAHLEADCLGVGMVTDVSGTSAGNVPVNFGRACYGGSYYAHVDLVDADGNRTLWTPTPGPNFWPYGFAVAPLRATTLNVSYTVTRPGSDFITYVSPLGIAVGGARVTPSPPQPCIAGRTVAARDRILRDLPLGERVTIEVTVAMHTAYGGVTGDVADCDSSEYDGETLTFSTVVSRTDLASLDGVTITAPVGSPYAVTIVIHGV